MYSNVFDVIYFEVSEIRENKKCKYLENENFFSSYETIHCTLRAIIWQKIFFFYREETLKCMLQHQFTIESS